MEGSDLDDDALFQRVIECSGATVRPLTSAPDPETRARLQALADEPLPIEEWKRLIAIPLTDDERERTLELVRWFTTRYPTAAERLAYVRRAYRRWTAGARAVKP